MKYLVITEVHSLTPLLDFNINDANIDLHNDFECTGIKYNNNVIEFFFKRIADNIVYREQNAVIIFWGVVETNFESLCKNSQIGDIKTITNFARGELSDKNQHYQDKDIRYFFVDFLDGCLIDILCKEGIVFLW